MASGVVGSGVVVLVVVVVVVVVVGAKLELFFARRLDGFLLVARRH